MRETWLCAEERQAWEMERGRLALMALQKAAVRRKDSPLETRVKGSTLMGEWGVKKRRPTIWTPPGLRLVA